jgi:hypothetical protein
MSEKTSKVGIWALAGKLGGKLVAIFAKLLKGLKFTKLGLALATLSGYSAIYTWKFALLIMLAVGWHESGHVWAMKKMGFKTKGFYFLPFLGGVAVQEDEYKSYGQNVFVAMMGPIWGTVLAFLCAVGYWVTHNPMFAAAAS